MRQFEDEFGLPEEVRQGLGELYRPARGMEGGRDAGILGAARRAGGAGGQGGGGHWRRWGAVGMAAAVALAAGIMWSQVGSKGPAYARTGDIRDAFYLARQMKAEGAGGGGGKVALEGWDANGDGVVNEADVRVLALAAVKVSGGGGSGGGVKGVMP